MKAKDGVDGRSKVQIDGLFVLLFTLIFLSVLLIDVGLVLFFFFRYEYQGISGEAFAAAQGYFEPVFKLESDYQYYDDVMTNDLLTTEPVDDYLVESLTEAYNEPTTEMIPPTTTTTTTTNSTTQPATTTAQPTTITTKPVTTTTKPTTTTTQPTTTTTKPTTTTTKPTTRRTTTTTTRRTTTTTKPTTTKPTTTTTKPTTTTTKPTTRRTTITTTKPTEPPLPKYKCSSEEGTGKIGRVNWQENGGPKFPPLLKFANIAGKSTSKCILIY